MKKIITLFLLLTTYFGHTQTLTVEAESGKLYRGASIQNCSSCSNLQQVGDMGGTTAESAYFASTVNVATAGTYRMNLSFSSGDTRTLFISPNGSIPVEVALNSGDWGVVATQEIQIELNAGTNTIKFYNYNGYTPNIDKYTLTLAIASNPCTTCIGPFEAENGTVFAPATVQGCDTCSNGQQVGDLGYSDRYFTQDVMISTPGTYRVYISYSSGSPRSLSVTANETTTVSGVFHSIDWDAVFVKYLDITLAAGTNTLKFHTPGDWSPNIDKFRLELLDANSNLNDLKIDGITVSGFSSATTDYTYNVAFGTTTVPQITLTNSANSTATKVITQASGLPGTATVVITSSDATTTKTYTVNYGINPIISVEAESGKLYRGASIQNCSSCSNLQQVGDMGGTGAESAYFTSTVTMATAGTYKMNISFSSGDTRTLFISPNGSTPVEVALNSGGWGVIGTQEIQIELNAGTNTIKFYNYNSYTPNIDKYTLTLAKASNPCITCIGPFEAENGTVFAPATVQGCDTCSNGQQVGDLGYSDRYFTQDVTISTPGTYRVYISYSSGSPRSLSVTANETTTVSGVFHSIDWDAVFVKHLDITLAAGTNTLKFHTPGDWAPNIDKFRLELLNTTWTGGTSTVWGDTSNWSSGVPVVISDVTIAPATHQPMIGNNVTINSLTIATSASLTVNSGSNLTITNAIVNTGTLTIANNANLIQVNDVLNSGAGTTVVNRISNLLTRNEYTLWSSPVINQNLLAFSPVTLPTRFYNYNESNNKFSAVPSPNMSPFIVGGGYLIRMPDSNVLANYNTGNSSMNFAGAFTGTVNNGNISKAIVYSGATFGYNTIGNPYPSTIDAAAFIAANSANIESSLYFWRKVNQASGTAYAVYNAMGSTATPSSTLPNGTIQVGQGFIVKAKSGATAVNFTNAVRLANNQGQFFKTKKEAGKDRLWLNLTATSGTFSQALIGYTANATLGVDIYDAKYINDSPVALTSSIENEEYSIQGRPSFDVTDVVALNFKTDEAGEYSISLDRFDGVFAKGQDVYLVDSKTGTETSLKDGSYTFNAASGADNTRFSLKFQKTLKVITTSFDENNVSIYQINGSIYINSKSVAISSVKVFDIQGRLVGEKRNIKANTTEISNLSAKNQILIVNIVGEDNSEVTKKIMN
jgi:Carbohydrate binding module (family 35)